MSTEATPDIDAQEEVPGYKAPEKKDLKDIVSCYFVPFQANTTYSYSDLQN